MLHEILHQIILYYQQGCKSLNYLRMNCTFDKITLFYCLHLMEHFTYNSREHAMILSNPCSSRIISETITDKHILLHQNVKGLDTNTLDSPLAIKHELHSLYGDMVPFSAHLCLVCDVTCCCLDISASLLIGNMVLVRNVKLPSVASHLKGLHSLL